MEVTGKARKNRISIVCPPSHTSRRMQLLDVGFMFPPKTHAGQKTVMVGVKKNYNA
jgi:hypothetical protein